MTVIGIYDDHNSSAALSIDGKIIFAAQEERFTKRKNEKGFPKKTVEYILKTFGLDNSNIDIVAMSTIERTDINNLRYKIDTLFSVQDHLDMMENYWKPKLNSETYPIHYIKNIMDTKFKEEDAGFYSLGDDLFELDTETLQEKVIQITIDDISKFMQIDKSKIQFLDHHTCHIMYGYYANVNKKEKTIGLTVDAYGDGKNQTVWMIENDKFELLDHSNQCELARLYRMVTLYLRMKPLEHEFKVMGLAPYAKEAYVNSVVAEFDDLLAVDGLKIIHKNRPTNLFEYLNEKLKYHRFDNIAGGIQKYTEGLLIQLLTSIHKETGIKNFVFSGGVAMNVKANKILGELDFVENFFVAGSSSDESQSIGACYYINNMHGIKNEPLENLYLGTDISDESIHAYIQDNNVEKKYTIEKNVTNDKLSQLLADGEVLARVVGKMEFGSRALGNRSILANPSHPNVVKQINEIIKDRDFWMPFAATILDKYESKYLDNKKGYESRFMAIAMDTKKEYLHEIKAGTHPYDETVRPQILTKDQNTSYYDLIDLFAQKTGIGAILNTSYNLHGLPVVNDVDDAFHVFENSGLRYLVLNDVLISKI